MTEPVYNDGWAEWSKYVLKELERLNDCYEKLYTELSKLQSNCPVHKMEMVSLKEIITNHKAELEPIKKLAALEPTMKYMEQSLLGINKQLENIQRDFNGRLDKIIKEEIEPLQHWRYYMLGGMALAGVLITVALKFF